MSLWIVASLAAAVFQTVRFMLQKSLSSTRLSAAGATFARFVYSAPLAVAATAIYIWTTGQAIPSLSAGFWAFALFGGVAQIVATIFTVMLFKARNFAVGVTFSKTEVLFTVLIGFVLLGDRVSLWGLGFILCGILGVLILSAPADAARWRAGDLWNRATGLGLVAGVLFSISAVSYRGASLELDAADPFIRAGVTLGAVTTLQTALMLVWLTWREPGEVGRVGAAWASAGCIGLTSMAGSFGWFLAFTLQNAAYVKALGQVELIFGLMASILFFKEAIRWREILGIGVLAASIVGLVLTL